MTETPTPAQDLAALDRVVDIALEADLITEEFAEILDRLRATAEQRLDRHRALGKALAAEWNWDALQLASETERATDRVIAAIAAAGAEIVWPSPDTAEAGDRAAEGDTAAKVWPSAPPRRFTRLHLDEAAEAYGFPDRPDCGDSHRTADGSLWEYEADSHADHLMVHHWGRTRPPTPTAREKILSEVATLTTTDLVPDFARPEGILAEAVKFASEPVDRYDPPGIDSTRMRANTLRAAALLVIAVERLDGLL